MFGRQHDITARDQRTQIDVPLPDDAIAAITNTDDTPAADDFMNSPLMQDDASLDDHLDSLVPEQQPAPVQQPPTSAPEIAAPEQRDIPVQQPPRRLSTGDLLDVKRAALSELSPIIDVLDVKPEEKFRTLIELIQSTDNQALLPAALSIAKTIPDKQVRAQALLAIINETNYFSKQNAGF